MNLAHEYPITRSRENYLRVIYEFLKVSKSVRSSDVADRLGITRASVSEMMSELKKSGLIEKEKYGRVFLTERGYKLAAQINYKHDLIKAFLITVLGVDEFIAETDACRMEYFISPKTAEKLNDALNKRTFVEKETG